VGLSAIRAEAARNALVLHNLAIKVMLRLDDAAKVYPAVYAGVGTLVLAVVLLGRWVRMGCARLLCGHEAFPFVVRVPGCANTCGAISLSDVLIVT
jgi:hypothetical protein